MLKEQIIELLKSLHEHVMAKDIFVPVFNSMGMKGVRYTGGTDERGIDVEYYELTYPEKRKSYVGIQFKKGDLTYGASGGKNTVKEIKNQAEEAFEKEIVDIDGHSTVRISRFVVATTGLVNEPARTYIGKARQQGGTRGIDFWDGDRLAEYIQKYWMDGFVSYFKEQIESLRTPEVEELIVTAEYIENNYEEIVTQCKKVSKTVNRSELNILTTIAKMCVINNTTSVKKAEFLIEVGQRESFYEEEFRHLGEADLGYLYIDEDGLSLNSYAECFMELANKIISEIVEADENDELFAEIFDEIVEQ